MLSTLLKLYLYGYLNCVPSSRAWNASSARRAATSLGRSSGSPQLLNPSTRRQRIGHGQGLVLYAKRLERGHFVWPSVSESTVSLTPAKLAMLTV